MRARFESGNWLLLVFLWLIMTLGQVMAAMTPANTQITGQAKATYFDVSEGVVKEIYSNVAIITVAPLPVFELEFASEITVSDIQRVNFPHRLINTGNVTTGYTFTVTDLGNDSGALHDFKLYYDIDINGAYSDGDQLITEVACDSNDATQHCYELDSVKPNGIAEVVIDAALPRDAEAGDAFAVGAAAEALVQMNRNASGLNVSANTAATSQALKNMARVISGASLQLSKSVVPACDIPKTSGDIIHYKTTFSNYGHEAPNVIEFEIDGQPLNGILLQDELPSNLTLNKASIVENQPVFTPVQGMLVVQYREDYDTKRWTTYESWDTDKIVSKVGVFYAERYVHKNISGHLEYDMAVNKNVTSARIYTQALMLSGDSNVNSNIVCNSLEPENNADIDGQSGTDGAAGEARIRFMRPANATPGVVQAANVDDFYTSDRFVDTEFYYRDNYDNYSLIRDGAYIQLHSNADNVNHDDFDTVVAQLRSESKDVLNVTLLETGVNTGIFRSIRIIRLSDKDFGAGRSCPASGVMPNYTLVASECVLNVPEDSVINVQAGDNFVGEVDSVALIEPKGIVFDTLTSEPLAGATVTFHNADGSIAIDVDTGLEYVPSVTDETGRYDYPRLAIESAIATGKYYISVQPPEDYVFPSTMPQNTFSSRSISHYSYGVRGASGTSDGIFTLTSAEPVIVVDLPVDPKTDVMFALDKSTTTPKASIGDIVKYDITLSNRAGADIVLYRVEVKDQLPYGFRYVKGSARLDDEVIADPAGADTSTLLFSRDVGNIKIQIPAEETRTLSYFARITAGAVDSDGVNTAQATTKAGATATPMISNQSRAVVEVVTEGVLLDKAIVIGRVSLDQTCTASNKDKEGKKDTEDNAIFPVSGVKIFMADGRWASTDGKGRYSLYGVDVGEHAVKVDPISLPKGVELKATDTRHMRDGGSRWLDIKAGEMHRADFVVACPDAGKAEAIVAEVKSRNASFDESWKLDQVSEQKSETTKNDELKAGSDGDFASGVEYENKQADSEVEKANFPGYSLQLSETNSKSEAERELAFFKKHIKEALFIKQSGDKFVIQTGFALQKTGLAGLKQKIKAIPGMTFKVVGVNFADLPASVATTYGEEGGVALMPDPEELVKKITRQQGKKGTWLWPKTEDLADGRFIFVTRKGLTPKLYVNDVLVPKDNLGIQVMNRKAKSQLLAWYGVPMKPGKNTLKVTAKDPFGNQRTLSEKTFIQAGNAVKIVMEPESGVLSADGGDSVVAIRLKVLDEKGNMARGVYYATLTASDGKWLQPDIQDKTTGHQIRISNGTRLVHLRSGQKPGDIRIKAQADQMEVESKIAQVAPIRPLIAIGTINISVGRTDLESDGEAPTSDEFADISDDFELEGSTRIFMQGQVWGDKMLTFAYDSEKESNAELARDVNPTDYYPVYGDASARGYEAQSRSKVYAKLEKDKNSVMWGDFSTTNSSGPQDLASVQRTLTGFNAIYDEDNIRAQIFASEVEDGHIIELVPGNGTAMNYRLQYSPITKNSETIVLVTYDRDNEGLVISEEVLTRFDDYMLDDVTGYLTFREVVPSFDEDDNPIYVRIDYDTEDGQGNDNLVAGARVTFASEDDRIISGVSFTRDEDPFNGADLIGVFSEIKPDTHSKVAISTAEMRHNDASKQDGVATLIRGEYNWDEEAKTVITWGRAQEGFTNPSSGISAGREELSAKHIQKLDNDMKVDLELVDSQSLITDERKSTIGATASGKFDEDWTVKAGVRHIRQENVGDNESFNTVIVGAERAVDINGRSGKVKAEYEQDIGDASRQRVKLVGDLLLEKERNTKAYVAFEHINSLSGVGEMSSSVSKDTLSIGVKGKTVNNMDTYTEYRLRGSLDDRETEAVTGVKTRYEIRPGFTITPTAELVRVLEGDNTSKNALAVSVSMEDKRNPKARKHYRIETRDTESNTYLGVKAAYVGRINEEWSGLAREELRMEFPEDISEKIDHTLTLGLAKRGNASKNQHDLLLMYKNKEKRGESTGDDQSTHVLSAHQNIELSDNLTFSNRVGGKIKTVKTDDDSFSSDAVLVDGRLIWDINDLWSVDAHGGMLSTNNFEETRYSAGLGAYLTVMRNLRVGVDYNLKGFEDDDLDPQGYNAEGLNFKLQYKFDEKDIQWLFE